MVNGYVNLPEDLMDMIKSADRQSITGEVSVSGIIPGVYSRCLEIYNIDKPILLDRTQKVIENTSIIQFPVVDAISLVEQPEFSMIHITVRIGDTSFAITILFNDYVEIELD